MKKLREPDTRDEHRWRESLDRLEPATVLVKLQQHGGALDTPILGIVDDAPHPPCRFVERWLSQKRQAADIRDKWRFWAIFVLTLIAALAAIVAAWPVVFPSDRPVLTVSGARLFNPFQDSSTFLLDYINVGREAATQMQVSLRADPGS